MAHVVLQLCDQKWTDNSVFVRKKIFEDISDCWQFCQYIPSWLFLCPVWIFLKIFKETTTATGSTFTHRVFEMVWESESVQNVNTYRLFFLRSFYTNLPELFCQFISWTNWVNSGKSMYNCWISCQVMADNDMEKIYDNLIIINLYILEIG